MGYSQTFFCVDLDRLRALHGSGDEALLEEIIASKGEALEDNDAFFEDEIEEGDCPDSVTALRDILSAKTRPEGAEGVYAYTLGILCDHLGQVIGDEVYAVRDHPYRSQLVRSGPPIPIPYDRADFPEIGHLALADIPAEIARIDKAPPKAKTSLLLTILSSLSGGMIGKQMNDEEAVEDMAAYRATLQEALDKRLSVVSFRY